MAALFDEGSSDEEGNLKINTNYADKYNQWREKEEYQKLKDKYGESGAMRMMANGDESSSTSESEDEDGEAWDSEVEKKFFQTLASLKKKDPSIYNTEKQFFDKTAQPAPPKKSTKEDAFTLRDYERKLILEKGGKMSDDEDAPPRTFHEEQEQLKIGFKAALQDSDSETEDLFQIRPKTNAQKEKEEEEYKEWLKGRKEDINNEETKKQLEPLKEYWSNPKLDENESFLKDFFLNKRYKCSEDKNYIPTYDEVVHESEGDLSEDEKILEKQLEFEHKYNFRFEEPDPEFIKRYPRTIADSMRRPDTSRKAKRDEVKERKKQEKQEKKEELKMLKKYKLKEIQEKLEQLKSITGNASLPFQDDDLQGDFDPEQYDKKMGEIFNQDYYHVNDEDQKPEFPYDPEIDDENWDDYKGQQAYPSTSGENYNDDYDGPHCEDPDFNMDCDYEDAKEESKREIIDMTRRNRGRKKSIFAQKLETKKPVFDPQQYPNYEEYLEEYYKLDYEDIIGDQPVRFKYRTVVENDFGLDIEEILVAREKELNQWCSVKKMSQYRTEREEMADYYTYITKKRNLSLKKRILPSVFVENPEELMVADQEKDRKKRRRNQGKDENPEPQQIQKPDDNQEIAEETVLKKKKRKNKGKDEPLDLEKYQFQTIDLNHSEKTEEVCHKRKKEKTNDGDLQVEQQPQPKKLKIDKQPAESEITVEAIKPIQGNVNTDKKKKKKKKKKNIAETNDIPMSTIANEPSKKQADKTQSQPVTEKPDTIDKKEKAGQINPSTDETPRKKVKTNKKPIEANSLGTSEPPKTESASNSESKKKKKNKKKKNKNLTANGKKVAPPANKANKKSATIRGFDISDDRLKAYGIRNPKKFKNAMIFGNMKKAQA
uniref:Protein KRI1 homolog n=1 Tax=Daphnia magna TaxID=35525 RepID=A0A0P4XH51_9CRUS